MIVLPYSDYNVSFKIHAKALLHLETDESRLFITEKRFTLYTFVSGYCCRVCRHHHAIRVYISLVRIGAVGIYRIHLLLTAVIILWMVSFITEARLDLSVLLCLTHKI